MAIVEIAPASGLPTGTRAFSAARRERDIRALDHYGHVVLLIPRVL